jgi:hypothetical protein
MNDKELADLKKLLKVISPEVKARVNGRLSDLDHLTKARELIHEALLNVLSCGWSNNGTEELIIIIIYGVLHDADLDHLIKAEEDAEYEREFRGDDTPEQTQAWALKGELV